MKYIDDITKFIFISDELKKSDIIFIPGGSYAEIAETAAMLWNERYASFILPSGKFGVNRGYFPGPRSKSNVYNKNYYTEWEFLNDVLIKNGVREKYILREDKATYTFENAMFSKKITDELDIDVNTAIICCKAFHARRCLMCYESVYPNTKFIVYPTETQGINKYNWFNTKEGIDKVMGEVERCGSQFKDVIKEYYLTQKESNNF